MSVWLDHLTSILMAGVVILILAAIWYRNQVSAVATTNTYRDRARIEVVRETLDRYPAPEYLWYRGSPEQHLDVPTLLHDLVEDRPVGIDGFSRIVYGDGHSSQIHAFEPRIVGR